MDAYTPLFSVLRSGKEHVKVAIEADLPAGADRGQHATPLSLAEVEADHDSDAKADSAAAVDDDPATLSSSASTASLPSTRAKKRIRASVDQSANRRIFALVINVEQGHEEACIFVLKRRQRDPKKAKIVDGLPILPGFKASIRQVAAEQQASHALPSSSVSSSKLQIDMTLAGKTISAVSEDAQAIRDMLQVVREAAQNAEAFASEPQSGAGETHAWAEQYMDVDRRAIGTQAPIFSRFTTSSILPPARPQRRRAPSPAHDGEVKVSYATFNVNGQMPTAATANVDNWLHVSEDEPDILIVSLQEADSSGLSYVVWTPHVEAAWTQTIERAMQRSVSDYTKLTCKQLVGLLIFVFVRTTLLPRIDSPAVSSVGVGFGGWAANKGAVGVRFTLDGTTSLCFVNSHLSAFHTPEALQRRRWDHHEILRRLKFIFLKDNGERQEKDTGEAAEGATDDTKIEEKHKDNGRQSAAESALRAQLERSSTLGLQEEKRQRTEGDDDDDEDDFVLAEAAGDISHDRSIEVHRWRILDHDIVIWGGDLNFRIDLSTTETKRLIRRRQFEQTLLKFDQLRSELTARASFVGFEEQSIDFAPTYKFDRGTDEYDTSEKQRCPAWTDRVLYHEKQRKDESGAVKDKIIEPVHYESETNIRISDHKPVLATFLLRLPRPDSAERPSTKDN